MAINNSYQTTTRFALTIDSKDFESFSSRVVDFQIPNISSPEASAPSAIQDVKFPGTGLQYSPLDLTIIASGGLSNLIQIFVWLQNNPVNCTTRDLTVMGYAEDDTVNFAIRFEDAFPVNISTDQFTTTDARDTIIKFNVTFQYVKYGFI